MRSKDSSTEIMLQQSSLQAVGRELLFWKDPISLGRVIANVLSETERRPFPLPMPPAYLTKVSDQANPLLS